MGPTHRCEQCGATGATLHCGHCKVIFYCSQACQKRNWRLHKRACTTDPDLRRFVPVEMAVERALAKQPPMEQAPKDATCYICLEGDGDGKSSKLMRGCACRGDSAGFVHLECLTKLAMSKAASGDIKDVYAWIKCGNCKQGFRGALQLEMTRRSWRYYRSSQDPMPSYNSSRSLAHLLGNEGEVDAANQLMDEAATCVGNDQEFLLDLKICRAQMLARNNQKLEALGLLKAMLPEAKEAHPHLYYQALEQLAAVSLQLGRNPEEAHEAASELVTFTRAKFGLEDFRTLGAMTGYAIACAMLGRDEEAKASFEDALSTHTRVLGRDHPHTQKTRQYMRSAGFAVPPG